MGLVVIPGVATSSFAVSSSVSCSFAYNSNFQRSADASISGRPLYHLPITRTHHRKTRSCLQLTTLHGTSSQSSFTTTTSKKTDSSTAVGDETSTIIKTITKEEVSRMSLSQLLQRLNDWNVRYTPNATRLELEELVLMMQNSNGDNDMREREQESFSSKYISDDLGEEPPISIPSRSSKNESKKISSGSNSLVVDAVVLNDNQQHEDDDQDNVSREGRRRRILSTGYSDIQQEVKGHRQRMHIKQEQQQYYQQNNQQSSPRQNANKQRERQNVAKQQRYAQQRYRNNYDLYANDDGFNLSSSASERGGGRKYDNGIQIFIMGFYEAGKTATQLALDAILDPFINNDDDEQQQWWYDEERDREVLDVSILDYSPHDERGGRRREYDDNRSRRTKQNTRRKRRQGGYSKQNVPSRRASSPMTGRRRSSSAYYGKRGDERQGTAAQEFCTTDQGHKNDTKPISSPNLQRDKTRQRSHAYSNDENADKIRPNYGLYHSVENQSRQRSRNQTNHENAGEQRHQQAKKTQWKYRLRRKFDAALGLQYPTASSSSGEERTTYYESWKIQMKEMDDERKEILRQRMKEESDLTASTTSKQSSSGTSPVTTQAPPSYRNNRRARMRAKSQTSNGTPLSPPPSRRMNKSHLDEVPFWRESGTIASLLFDNRPSLSSSVSSLDSRDGGRRRTSLEVRYNAYISHLSEPVVFNAEMISKILTRFAICISSLPIQTATSSVPFWTTSHSDLPLLVYITIIRICI